MRDDGAQLKSISGTHAQVILYENIIDYATKPYGKRPKQTKYYTTSRLSLQCADDGSLMVDRSWNFPSSHHLQQGYDAGVC
jgi:hypothetical protein